MEKKKTVKPSLKANTNVKANEDELVFKEETTTSITDKQQKEMLTLIKDLSSKVERLEAEKSNTTLPKEETLADDYLEIPATFFAYSVSFNLSGDVRRGKVSMNPNNGKSVKFNPHYRYNRKSPKRGLTTVSICRTIIHSKAEAQWLREHSLFGIRFFENISTAIDSDVLKAEKMVQVSNMLSAMSDMRVIDRAKKEGINIQDPDINNIKQKLIKKITDDSISNETKAKLNLAKQVGVVKEGKVTERAAQGSVNDVY